MFIQKQKKPMRQQMRNIGKSRFTQSINNYNSLREAIDNQMQHRIDFNVAAKPRPRFQIV